MRWWSWFPRSRTNPVDTMSEELAIEKTGELLTPNLRALHLTMTASDLLLSMGISVDSATSKALDITDTYCTRPVYVNIQANIITLSQLRGIYKEPLSLTRPVASRQINYMTVHKVQELVYDIRRGKYSLSEAETKLDTILEQHDRYPWWLLMLGNGAIIAGVTMMFTQSIRAILLTLVIGLLADRLMALMVRQAIPAFFRQAITAGAVTVAATVIAYLAGHGVHFFATLDPTLLVVGGIIMLVAGLAIVSALQDAIDDYTITASASILRVIIQTIGIVIGILIGLYISRFFWFSFSVSPDSLQLSDIRFQILGGGVIAGGYALTTQTKASAVIWAGIVGGGAVAVSAIAKNTGIAAIPASGLAAVFVGTMAALFSKAWQSPSAGIIAAGIVPLVPGLALFNGLLQLTDHHAGSPMFVNGIGTLFTAVAIALTIAAGASFGGLVGRPLHRKITHRRNILPFARFMQHQLRLGKRHNLAKVALRSNDPNRTTVTTAANDDTIINN